MKERRFELVNWKHNKFWTIEIDGDTYTTSWGKIGASPTYKDKTFPDSYSATVEYDKKISEKLKKGYIEVFTTPASKKKSVNSKAPAKKKKTVDKSIEERFADMDI
jgi:predicted DNA-binding WGR domain protein